MTGALAERQAEPLLDVHVFGKPAPQGSKTRNKFGGVRDDNAERLRPWRESVKAAVLALGPPSQVIGPMRVSVVFTFDKPASAPKTRRVWPEKRSTFDLDKLQRAVFDALSDCFWRDDAQVVEVTARKVFVGDDPAALPIPGASILVWAVAS